MPYLIFAAVVLGICFSYLFAIKSETGEERFESFAGHPVAHRGLHGKTLSPENSLAAFARAADKGYGIELDVYLLSDGNLAVFHDKTLYRMTGKQGNIKNLTAEKLNEYKLENSEETIPTLSDVLYLVNGRVPLIIELKCENNVSKLCKKVLEELEGYKGPYVIESFDPRPLIWLRKNRPDVTRGQLAQGLTKEDFSFLIVGRLFLANLLLNFLTRPHFIAYKFSDRKNLSNRICTRLFGSKSVLWTITNIEDFGTAQRENAISVFEGFLPRMNKK